MCRPEEADWRGVQAIVQAGQMSICQPAGASRFQQDLGYKFSKIMQQLCRMIEDMRHACVGLK